MITEDYVNFETAKFLKKKGFDEECETWYAAYWSRWGGEPDGDRSHILFQPNKEHIGDKDYEFLCYAPTLQMATKWLEKVYHILVVADYEYECTDKSWYYKIYKLGKNGKPENVEIKGVSYDKDDNPTEHIVGYRDYERSYLDYTTRKEACEAGIKYCLENLI